MSSLNKAQVIGNLGNDPETRHMPSGAVVTEISVATSERWKDKETGEKKEKTEWHRITFFGKVAEIAAEYLSKGKKVYVEGRIQTDKWQDKEGNDRYSTKIIGQQLVMLSGKSDGQKNSSPPSNNSNQHQSENRPPSDNDFDDDIPF